jgi:hypothetical protein
MLHENAIKYLSCRRLECLNLYSLHFCAPISFRCVSLLSFARALCFATMDAGVARSSFPGTIRVKKSGTIVSVFSRGAEHQSKSFSKSCGDLVNVDC